MKIRTALVVTAFGVAVYGTAFSADSMTIPMKNAKGESVGEAKLTQTPNGVLIQATLSKLPPGEHGFHIHTVGKCEPPFASAGDHFNPETKQHGYFDPQGRHAGDLPNVYVPESGTIYSGLQMTATSCKVYGMGPYPKELRVRVVTAVEDGGLSIPETARIFQVGLTFIKKMLRLHRAGESLEPRHGGGPVPVLQEKETTLLRQEIRTCPMRRWKSCRKPSPRYVMPRRVSPRFPAAYKS